MNTGSISVTLSQVTIRYWFTSDGGATTFSTWCDYALIACSNVTDHVASLTTTRPGADSYLDVGYTAGAGALAAGANTGETQLRFNKTDWSNFNETNDYSYSASSSYTDAVKVTVYVYGNLVWGAEP